MKICFTCKKEFAPSSRHRNCPKCRQHNYVMCQCGKRKTRQAALCKVCTPTTASFNNNWKGGKTKHSKGYIMCQAPEHPRANNGYVFEHILVMEEILGRFLLTGENVHHKNGVKSDNSKDNLELWVTTQPSGQRPADLVAWAHKILDLYE